MILRWMVLSSLRAVCECPSCAVRTLRHPCLLLITAGNPRAFPGNYRTVRAGNPRYGCVTGFWAMLMWRLTLITHNGNAEVTNFRAALKTPRSKDEAGRGRLRSIGVSQWPDRHRWDLPAARGRARANRIDDAGADLPHRSRHAGDGARRTRQCRTGLANRNCH